MWDLLGFFPMTGLTIHQSRALYVLTNAADLVFCGKQTRMKCDLITRILNLLPEGVFIVESSPEVSSSPL